MVEKRVSEAAAVDAVLAVGAIAGCQALRVEFVVGNAGVDYAGESRWSAVFVARAVGKADRVGAHFASGAIGVARALGLRSGVGSADARLADFSGRAVGVARTKVVAESVLTGSVSAIGVVNALPAAV